MDSVLYTNLRFGYDFDIAGTSARAFLNVENLFDEDPPLAPGGFSFFSGQDQTNANLFDRFGRRYTAGVQFQF